MLENCCSQILNSGRPLSREAACSFSGLISVAVALLGRKSVEIARCKERAAPDLDPGEFTILDQVIEVRSGDVQIDRSLLDVQEARNVAQMYATGVRVLGKFSCLHRWGAESTRHCSDPLRWGSMSRFDGCCPMTPRGVVRPNSSLLS